MAKTVVLSRNRIVCIFECAPRKSLEKIHFHDTKAAQGEARKKVADQFSMINRYLLYHSSWKVLICIQYSEVISIDELMKINALFLVHETELHKLFVRYTVWQF